MWLTPRWDVDPHDWYDGPLSGKATGPYGKVYWCQAVENAPDVADRVFEFWDLETDQWEALERGDLDLDALAPTGVFTGAEAGYGYPTIPQRPSTGGGRTRPTR